MVPPPRRLGSARRAAFASHSLSPNFIKLGLSRKVQRRSQLPRDNNPCRKNNRITGEPSGGWTAVSRQPTWCSRWVTNSLTHSLTHSTRSLARSLTHSLTHSPATYARTDSLTDSLTWSLTHSLTHPLTHSLTHSFTHSLTEGSLRGARETHLACKQRRLTGKAYTIFLGCARGT